MKCPKCHFENPDDIRFCGKCGMQLLSPEEVSDSYKETIQVAKRELTIGSSFAQRYQVIEELGKGGMGKVYKVLDKELGEKVALKLLNPEIAADGKTIERFRNELKMARNISHKNVCRMYHLGKEEGAHYITMEYVAGEDLKRLIRKVGQLSAGKTVFIAKQICEGLAEAHRLGVVHRDLKPQNIMVDEEGNSRIMDFGIARSLKAKGITGAGVIIGTPEYMSPEQVEGKDVDHRSDIYSLGIILYEMVTGRIPFEGDTPLSIAVKQKSEIPKDPKEINSQISEDLNRLILKCMEKSREKRFQTAEELLSELSNLEKGIPTTERIIPERKPTTSHEITVTFRKGWLVIGAIVAAIIVAGITLLYFLNKGASISPEPESAKKMLVVLPFKNLGPSEDEYFADGITEEIMSRLGSIPELGIIARSSIIQYKQTNKPIQQIGNELGADYILGGTVRWQRPSDEQSKVRVTPQLIRVSDATQLWSDRYDAILADIFQVQSDIAKKVTQALDITLGEPERRALQAKPTDNLEAYDYYLKGNDYYNRSYLEKELRISIQLLEQAVELDPNFALAYSQLSRAHVDLYWFYYDRTEERLRKSKAMVDRALNINPDLSEAHLALGWYYYHGKLDYERALEQFSIVQKYQPSNSQNLYSIGLVQRRQGKFDDAIVNLTKASELDPRSGSIACEIGGTLVNMRRYAEAERWFDKAINLTPDLHWAYSSKSFLYLIWQGSMEKARAVLEDSSQKIGLSEDFNYVITSISLSTFDRNYREALDKLSLLSSEAFKGAFYSIYTELQYAKIYGLMKQSELEKSHYSSSRELLERKIKEYPEDAILHSMLGIAYAGLGRKKEAIREGKLCVELLPESKDAFNAPILLEDLAQIYTMVGEYDAALDQIDLLLSMPSYFSYWLLQLDPRWDPLRNHPRYQELLSKYK